MEFDHAGSCAVAMGGSRYVDKEPVAIVGMGCLLPGGVRGPEEFWELLCDGVDAITPVPASRWNNSRYAQGDQALMKVRAGGFLDDISGFDATFFGISPREAASMDPQQRMLLEVTWEALEDAGIVPEQLAGEVVSVYAGAFALDYKLLQLNPSEHDQIGVHTSTGVAATLVANRISHWFDLRGASVSLDTACSSSMTALHLACQDLWAERSELALAAGVNTIFYPEWTIAADRGGYLSADGRCKTFSELADGYGRGEGAGVLVLKPLSKAREAGDRIYALVGGTAINQDGHTTGITVPRSEAQVAVMKAACHDAQIDPSVVGYVEAHGTGTPVGDPVEVEAIGQVYGRGDGELPCLIGSVKTNIGHLEAAAGVAGVIKAALCLHNKAIPASLHYERPNPDIPFDRLGVQVVDDLKDFPASDVLRCAGVNSFGFGGANGHAVLIEYSEEKRSTDAGPAWQAVGISARSADALKQLAEAYGTGGGQHSLVDLCYTAGVRRQHHDYRAAFAVSGAEDLHSQLLDFASSNQTITASRARKTAFVFSGMGSQWFGMGRVLFETEPVFRKAAIAFDVHFAKLSGWSLLDVIIRGEDDGRMDGTSVAQPAIVMIQVAMFEVLRHRGITPDFVVGHSLGELTAVYAAGGLELPDLVELVYHRSRLQATLDGRGGMLAVGASASDVEELIKTADDVDVAAVNDASSITLAGPLSSLEQVAAALSARQVFNRMLRVDVPYHSGVMEEIREEFVRAVDDLVCHPFKLPVYTTQDGSRVEPSRVTSAYWYANLRDTVQFTSAMSSLINAGAEFIVEVSPHGVLQHAIDSCCEGQDMRSCATLMRDMPGDEALARLGANLYRHGVLSDWTRWVPEGSFVSLPTYPWQHREYWSESAVSRVRRIGDGVVQTGQNLHPLLGERSVAGNSRRTTTISAAKPAFLTGHVVGGQVVFPATGYLELMYEVASCRLGVTKGMIRHLTLQQALVLEKAVEVEVTIEDDQVLRVRSRSAVGSRWALHAAAEWSDVPGAADDQVSLDIARAACLNRIDAGECYKAFERAGYSYGAGFQQIGEVFAGDDQALAAIVVESSGFHFHPASLDAALQTLLAAIAFGGSDHSLDGLYLPLEIDEVVFHQPLGGVVYAYARLREMNAEFARGDVFVFNEQGEVVVVLNGVGCRRVTGDLQRRSEQGQLIYQMEWREVPVAETDAINGTWIIAGMESAARTMVEDLLCAAVDVRLYGGQAEVFSSKNLQGVVFVAGTEGASEQCNALLELVQHMLSADVETELVVVTDGASDGTSCDAAALWGMGRVLGNEHPELSVRLIDVDASGMSDLLVELAAENSEQEVRLREGQRCVSRLREYDSGTIAEEEMVDPEDSYRLIVDDPGRLRQSIRRFPRCAVLDDEVEIRVRAAGVNFKDVLKVRGLLDAANFEGNYRGPCLGLECCGVVTAVGKGVSTLTVGDEVLAFAAGAFGSYVTTKANLAIRKPSCWSFEHAASFPLVYLTAWYALKELAGVKRGERVLIHAATGGVGQAAVQLARMMGAEIYATAGSEEKRTFLREQGVEHVFDSRSDAFVEGVRQATGGEGADVVLNSLSGELLVSGLKVLSCFGRFVEIGKRDIDADAPLGLKPFQKNISFMALDLDLLLYKRPDEGRRMLEELMTFLHAYDRETNLPVTVYPLNEYESAFALLSQAGHIGKLVLSMPTEQVAVLPAGRHVLRRDGTYLISGGLSGLGLQTAEDFARRGAGVLVLMSRRGGGTEEAEDRLSRLRSMGVDVHAVRADVTSADDVKRVVDFIAADLPPLRGVVHSANVYDDGFARQMTAEQVDCVLEPKVRGAWLLHELTASACLDFFIMYSSISSTIGNAGQCNYAAANAYLESLAMYRRSLGLPALTISWGAIGGAGYVEEHSDVAELLERSGVYTLELRDAFSAMNRLLRDDTQHAVVADVDWNVIRERTAANAKNRYDEIVDEDATASSGAGESEFLQAVIACAASERAVYVTGELKKILADVLGYTDAEDVDCRKGFFDMGLDSMMAMELNTRLESLLGSRVVSTAVFRYPTVDALAGFLLKDLLPAADDVLQQDDVRSQLERELEGL